MELQTAGPAIRIVRILFSGKAGGDQTAIVAFIERVNPLPALTEEHLLTKPRIAALDIEEIHSVKESPAINEYLSKRFPFDAPEEDADRILTQAETFIRAAWAFHSAPSVKIKRAQPKNETLPKQKEALLTVE